jgi:hypothetical protein
VLPGNELFDRLYGATQWARDGDGAYDSGPLRELMRAHGVTDAAAVESMLRKVGAVETVVWKRREMDREAARERIDNQPAARRGRK